MSILITNATVITVDETNRVIENGAVYVEKDRIAAVGDARVLGEQYSMAETVVDGEGKVVLPGFVSTHNHVGYAVFRGRAEDIGKAPTHRLYLPMSGVMADEERQVIGALAVTELLRGCLLYTSPSPRD